ncbi:MAG: hypothetical protein L0220_07190 [Acidobacteria bacterium]|nr:hypothetical protein [Acidobacteriota bacterium]
MSISHAVDNTLAAIRIIILAIFLIGSIGTGTELLLLGHTETLWQCLPLVLISISFVALIAHALVRKRVTMRVFQVIMILFILSGLIGLMLHYQGKMEFKLETNPALSGMELFWETIKGATVPPVLAPGMMIQIGLIGLAYAYRQKVDPKTGDK